MALLIQYHYNREVYFERTVSVGHSVHNFLLAKGQ